MGFARISVSIMNEMRMVLAVVYSEAGSCPALWDGAFKVRITPLTGWRTSGCADGFDALKKSLTSVSILWYHSILS